FACAVATSDLQLAYASFGSFAHHSIQAPTVGDALQHVFAPSLELEPAAGDEILDGLRDEHLGWAGLGGYSCADRYREASDLRVDHLALTGVDAGPDLQPDRMDPCHDR